jgi:hypothetical protein
VSEESAYAQRTVEVKEFVRKYFTRYDEPVVTAHCKPRISFGSRRNKHALGVDMDVARKPPPRTKDIPLLRSCQHSISRLLKGRRYARA